MEHTAKIMKIILATDATLNYAIYYTSGTLRLGTLVEVTPEKLAEWRTIEMKFKAMQEEMIGYVMAGRQ